MRVVTHRTQRGIADALKSGADVARGRVLVYYPADLQYLPSDIPSLVGPILEGQADVVTGTKQGGYNKRFVSGIYNTLSRWLFGVRVKDLNSVKAYRRDLMEIVTMRPDWHRFMVVIAASQGFRLAERPVPVHPRRAGSSKFGVGRIPVGRKHRVEHLHDHAVFGDEREALVERQAFDLECRQRQPTRVDPGVKRQAGVVHQPAQKIAAA